MGERRELAITVAVTGLSAYVGYETGGLLGAEISNVVPAFVGGLLAMRKDNVLTVTEDATMLAKMDGLDLVAWIEADERHAAFLAEALEASWSTLDRHKVRMFSHVLADGMRDEARLDIDQLVIRTLRDLEAGHVQVLSVLSTPIQRTADWTSERWPRAALDAKLPRLAEGMDNLTATLSQHGCIEQRTDTLGEIGAYAWAVTSFGERCLTLIRAAGQTGSP